MVCFSFNLLDMVTMKTLQDEVFNKKTGLTEVVLVEWTYNPLIQLPEFTVWSGKDNITRNVPTNDLKRLERKINSIAYDLPTQERADYIKCLLLQK